MNKKTIIIRVSVEDHKKIKVLCASLGVTIQEFVEKLIKEKL